MTFGKSLTCERQSLCSKSAAPAVADMTKHPLTLFIMVIHGPYCKRLDVIGMNSIEKDRKSVKSNGS